MFYVFLTIFVKDNFGYWDLLHSETNFQLNQGRAVVECPYVCLDWLGLHFKQTEKKNLIDIFYLKVKNINFS